MAYTIPTFNLACNWWQTGNSPSAGAPDATGLCQLYEPSRTLFFGFDPAATNKPYVPIEIRTKTGNPFGGFFPPWINSIFGITDINAVEWYWIVVFWEYMHMGFSNEYILFEVFQCDDTGALHPATR